MHINPEICEIVIFRSSTMIFPRRDTVGQRPVSRRADTTCYETERNVRPTVLPYYFLEILDPDLRINSGRLQIIDAILMTLWISR